MLGCTTPGGPETKAGPGLVSCMQLVEEASRMPSENVNPRELVTDLQYHNLPSSWIEAHPDIFEQYIVDQLRYPRPLKGLVGQMRALAKFNVSRTLPSLSIPILVLHGDEDVVIPIDAAHLLSQKLPHADLCVLEGAGHLFWITHLHDAVRATASFLNRIITPDSKSHSLQAFRTLQPTLQPIRTSPTASSSKASSKALRAKL